MEMQFVIVTVKDGKALSAGKPCDYSTAKTFAEDSNKKYKKDGINHIIVPVGQPNQAALVTVSKNNPNYCSIDFYIDSNNMVEEEKYNDFLHKTNQDGCNSFVITNTGHILDTEC